MQTKRLSFGDPLVLITVFVLFLIGIFVLYTTVPLGVKAESWLDSLVARQMVFGAVSFGLLLLITQIDLQITKTLILQLGFTLVFIVLLAGLFIFGPVVNETHRWYHLGQFLFQPSEFAKIAVAFWTAFWVTNDKINNRVRILLGGFGLILELGLVVLQPDLGATAILLLVATTIVGTWGLKYEVGRSLVTFLIMTAIVVILAANSTTWLLFALIFPVAWLLKSNWRFGMFGLAFALLVVLSFLLGPKLLSSSYVPSYVRTRIESFVGARKELDQIRQSKIAIGSGGFWGKGVGQGTQSKLRFLPEYTTDFIYAAFVEERGFAGMILLFALYLLLFGRLVWLSFQVQDEYSRLIMLGLTVKLWFETFLNIGMNMGALPTKGVALPFVSYGGSSLLANAIIIGIILSLYRYEAKHDTISPSFGLA